MGPPQGYRPRALIFDYVVSPSGPLPRLCKLCPWCQKLARPRSHMFYQVCSNYAPGAKNRPSTGGHMFFLGLYRENIQSSSCLKTQVIEP